MQRTIRLSARSCALLLLCGSAACGPYPHVVSPSPAPTRQVVSAVPSFASTPTASPTSTRAVSSSGTIAFTSQRNDGMPELYVMNADGAQQTRLTHDLQNNSNLVWSPNGRMIAFETLLVHDDSIDNQIRVIYADGTGLRALTPEHGTSRLSNWSPDSRAIVFGSEDGDIYSVGIADPRLINLTNSPSSEISPQWSPDGSRIAYASDSDGPFNIYTMNRDGTEPVRLTELQSEASYWICWAPDGSKLAVVEVQDYKSRLYVVNSDGSQFSLLAGESPYNHEPSWSPGSDRIAFVSGPYSHLNVYVINIDGQGLSQLTHNSWSSAPAWSPDGTRIAFMSDSDPTDDYNFDIYVMNSDGSQQTRLTEDPHLDGAPVWEP